MHFAQNSNFQNEEVSKVMGYCKNGNVNLLVTS
jgi:hypothetical protein